MKRLILIIAAALGAFVAFADTTLGTITRTEHQLKRGTSNVGTPHATEAACIQAARNDAEARKATANYSCNPRINFAVTYSAPVVTPPPPPTGSYMPVVNMALIPPPNPGTSERKIFVSGEQPSPSDIGAFRTACDYSHMNNDDPIMFPGQQGRSHLHVFFGNTGANYASTPESIRTTGNSTCRGGIVNRSSYWVPAMIDTRDGRPVRPRDSGFYYKTGYQGIRPAQVVSFPPGFRMIAGDAKSDKPQTFVYYSCDGSNWQASIPVCRTGQNVEMTVNFPQCWDGRNLTSPDGRSHVAYSSPASGCPAGFPVALPEVSIVAMFPVANGSGADSSTWRLSSDNYPSTQPGGYSGHGDWFHGWEQEVMDTWVTRVLQRSMDGDSHIVGDGRAIY